MLLGDSSQLSNLCGANNYYFLTAEQLGRHCSGEIDTHGFLSPTGKAWPKLDNRRA